MAKKTGYDIIKFVQNGAHCHCVQDYVEGQIFSTYIQHHKTIEKQKLLEWIRQLTLELDKFHRQVGRACYQWVTPFTILLTEQEEIVLLDLDSQHNKDAVKQLQRREVRNHFMKDHVLSTYNRELSIDLYGYGKTLQYLFAHVELMPQLSLTQEWRFRYIVHHCLKKESSYSEQQFKHILKYLPNSKIKKPKKKQFIIKSSLAVVSFICLGILWLGAENKQQIREKSKSKQVSENKVSEEEKLLEVPLKEEDSYMELGLAYMVTFKDYEKSRRYFAMISQEDDNARGYEELAIYLLNGETNIPLWDILQQLEANMPDNNNLKHIQALIQVYEKINTEESSREVIRLGEMAVESPLWKLTNDKEEERMELLEYLGNAYERNGQLEKAAQMRAAMKTEEHQEKKKEELVPEREDAG